MYYAHLNEKSEVRVTPEKDYSSIVALINDFNTNGTSDEKYIAIYNAISDWAHTNRIATFEYLLYGNAEQGIDSLSTATRQIREGHSPESFIKGIQKLHLITENEIPVFLADTDISDLYKLRMYYRIIDARNCATNFTEGFPFPLDLFTRKKVLPEEIEATIEYCAQIARDMIREKLLGVNPVPIEGIDFPSYWHLLGYQLTKLLSVPTVDIALDLEKAAQQSGSLAVQTFVSNSILIQSAILEKLISTNLEERSKAEQIILGLAPAERDEWAGILVRAGITFTPALFRECQKINLKRTQQLQEKIQEFQVSWAQQQELERKSASLEIVKLLYPVLEERALLAFNIVSSGFDAIKKDIDKLVMNGKSLIYSEGIGLPFFNEIGLTGIKLEKMKRGEVLITFEGLGSPSISFTLTELDCMAKESDSTGIILRGIVQAILTDTLIIEEEQFGFQEFVKKATKILEGKEMREEDATNYELIAIKRLLDERNREAAETIINHLRNYSKFLAKVGHNILGQGICLTTPLQHTLEIYRELDLTGVRFIEEQAEFFVLRGPGNSESRYITAETNSSQLLYLLKEFALR